MSQTTSSIDSNTRVQLGILFTLLSTFATGAWWAAGMTRDVSAVRENSEKMTDAVLRLEGMGQEHAKVLVALSKDLESQERRIRNLEEKLR